MVLKILCASPKPPRITKPPPQPVPCRPPPPPASHQVTLTEYSRHGGAAPFLTAPTGSHPKAAVPQPAVCFVAHCASPPSGEPLSPPPHRRGPNLGHCSLSKPPRSDPGLRRDVPIPSSSATPKEVDLFGVFQHHQPPGQN